MIKIWSSQGFDSILLGQQYWIFSIPLHCTSTNHKSSSKYETNCLCPTTKSTTKLTHLLHHMTLQIRYPLFLLLLVLGNGWLHLLSNKRLRFASIWFFVFSTPSGRECTPPVSAVSGGVPPTYPPRNFSWPLLWSKLSLTLALHLSSIVDTPQSTNRYFFVVGLA